MEIFQLENLYKVNGITDYRLKNTQDLLKTHGIDYKAVNGYNNLDDVNKLLYEKFIINIYNAYGLEARATLIPKGIYFVEDIKYLVKLEDDEGEYFVAAGGVVTSIDKKGKKTVLHSWEDEEYKQHIKSETEISTYLRFEHSIQGRNEWLHVTGENSWY